MTYEFSLKLISCFADFQKDSRRYVFKEKGQNKVFIISSEDFDKVTRDNFLTVPMLSCFVIKCNKMDSVHDDTYELKEITSVNFLGIGTPETLK